MEHEGDSDAYHSYLGAIPNKQEKRFGEVVFEKELRPFRLQNWWDRSLCKQIEFDNTNKSYMLKSEPFQ